MSRYGDPLQHPQTEEYWGNVNPIGERACYDEGKRVAETLCFDYYREHGIEIRVARIFNTYGPNMSVDDGRVVSNFLAQALRGTPMTIYGDGKQVSGEAQTSNSCPANTPSRQSHPKREATPFFSDHHFFLLLLLPLPSPLTQLSMGHVVRACLQMCRRALSSTFRTW